MLTDIPSFCLGDVQKGVHLNLFDTRRSLSLMRSNMFVGICTLLHAEETKASACVN